MNFPVYFVDAFTRTKNRKDVTGNPAAVVILNRDDDIDDKRKREIAVEVNQPVTVFVSRGWNATDDSCVSGAKFTISWFSVNKELTICGHGALAAATIVFSKLNPELTSITFHIRIGLNLELNYDKERGLISIKLPAFPGQPVNLEQNPWVTGLLQTVFGHGSESIQSLVEVVLYSALAQKILIVLKTSPDCTSEELLWSLRPDFKGMVEAVPESLDVFGLGVTVQNNQTGNQLPTFYSRFFAPWVDINEDETCGSLHQMLAPYWSNKLGTERKQMLSRFASPRSGDVHVTHEGESICIKGQSLISLEGTFFN